MEKSLYEYLHNRCAMLEDVNFSHERLQEMWLDFIRIANKYKLVDKGIYNESDVSIAIIDKKYPEDTHFLYVSHPYVIHKILNEPREYPVDPTFYGKFKDELSYTKLENKHVLYVLNSICNTFEEELKALSYKKVE